jgi:TolB-like protein
MNQQPVYRFDGFEVDPEVWRLSRAGQEVHLDPVVLKLLLYLINNNDRLVTRQELMDTVWGDTVISEAALTKAVARLRKALGDDSATHRYLETVRSKGYRFVAKVKEESGRSLAVLPLKNLTGDSKQRYFADGLHDLLITELYKLPKLGVTSRQSTIRYRNSRMPITEIALELGVDALIEGSLLRIDDKIEVTIQLIDGRSDKHLWAERYTYETSSIFNMIADVAYAIGIELEVKSVSARSEGPIGSRMDQIDPQAINAYALSTAHLERLSRDGIRTAIGQLETAVAIEPGFAQAWSQLAVAHAMAGMFGFAQPRAAIEIAHSAGLRAVEADEQFYGGHTALGWTRLWTGEIDLACKHFRDALRLNPSDPLAIHGQADCLMFDGHMDESLARLRELVEISPFSVIDNIPLPTHLYMARRYDEAIIAATAMQVRLPQFSIHRFLFRVYWQQGFFDKALEEERQELERRGDTVLVTALEEGRKASGPTGAVCAMAKALVVRANECYVEPYNIAGDFARAGMADEALYWLDKAVENGSYEMHYLAFWPHLDFLRDDKRYKDLAARVYGHRAQDIRKLENISH